MSLTQFNRWVRVGGLPEVREALELKRGLVLLHLHTAVHSSIADFVLRLNGLPSPHRLTKHTGTVLKTVPSLFRTEAQHDQHYNLHFLRELHLCRGILAENGIVDIAPDGNAGTSSGVDLDFFGMSKRFRTGFAELSLATGAPVIMVSVSLDASGIVHVNFEPPLDSGPEDLPKDERVRSFVHGFVDFYREKWANEPWNIRWGWVGSRLRRAQNQKPIVQPKAVAT